MKPSMKTILAATLAAALLAACGIETAGTAATVAAMKKQEIEQGKATAEKLQHDLEAANRQAAQRTARAADEAR